MTILGKVAVPKPINLPSQRYLMGALSYLSYIIYILVPEHFSSEFKVRESRP